MSTSQQPNSKSSSKSHSRRGFVATAAALFTALLAAPFTAVRAFGVKGLALTSNRDTNAPSPLRTNTTIALQRLTGPCCAVYRCDNLVATPIHWECQKPGNRILLLVFREGGQISEVSEYTVEKIETVNDEIVVLYRRLDRLPMHDTDDWRHHDSGRVSPSGH